MSDTVKDRVEQYRAQDRSVEWISRTMGLQVAEVRKVFKAQDKALIEETIPNPQPEPPLPGPTNACRRGHIWTPKNTTIRQNGWRECRTCKKERAHRLLSLSVNNKELEASMARQPGRKETMTLSSVDPDIKYDQWKRPLIIPPGGGKPVGYSRATTVAGATEDLNNLIDWKVGRAMIGLVERPDLLLSAAAHRDDKQKMRQLAQEAAEAGGSSASATIGTALHAFVEKINHGQPTGTIPDDYKADVAAYQQVMEKITPLHMEQRIVIDRLKITGTPDLIASYDGENYICDLKTGSVDYPHKMAAQLAIYAHGEHYDHTTGQRTPLPAVNGQRGIIIHLPAGAGKASLHWIDLAAGWEAVQLAVQVREWRKRKGLLIPVDEFAQAVANLEAAGLEPTLITSQPSLIDQINAAADAQALGAVWVMNKSIWTSEHTALAAARKSALSA